MKALQVRADGMNGYLQKRCHVAFIVAQHKALKYFDFAYGKVQGLGHACPGRFAERASVRTSRAGNRSRLRTFTHGFMRHVQCLRCRLIRLLIRIKMTLTSCPVNPRYCRHRMVFVLKCTQFLTLLDPGVAGEKVSSSVGRIKVIRCYLEEGLVPPPGLPCHPVVLSACPLYANELFQTAPLSTVAGGRGLQPHEHRSQGVLVMLPSGH